MIRTGIWHDIFLVDQGIWRRICLRCYAKAPESSTLGVRWSMRGHDFCNARAPNQSCDCLAKDHFDFLRLPAPALCSCDQPSLNATFYLSPKYAALSLFQLLSSTHIHFRPPNLNFIHLQQNFISSITHRYGSYQADCSQEHWWQSSP
jgi:hypothetical protein